MKLLFTSYLWAMAHISAGSSLLPLGLFLYSRKKASEIIRWVAALVACSFLFDFVAFYFGSQGINTYPIGNMFVLVQAVILLCIYRVALQWNSKLLYSVAGTFVILFLINYIFIQGPFILNSYSLALSCLGLIICSLMYFQFVLKNLPEPFLHRSSMIWINIAVLIYFSGNLFLFMLYNYFVSGIWVLHNILNITKNILLFIAIWQSQRKINSTSS